MTEPTDSSLQSLATSSSNPEQPQLFGGAFSKKINPFLDSSAKVESSSLSLSSKMTFNPFTVKKTESGLPVTNSFEELQPAKTVFKSDSLSQIPTFSSFHGLKSQNPFLKTISNQEELKRSKEVVQENPFHLPPPYQPQSSSTTNNDNPFLSSRPIKNSFGKVDIKSRLGVKKKKEFLDPPDFPTHGCTIQVNNIPPKYFAKEFLSPFFSKYGSVIKIDMKKLFSKRTALITFSNHQSAQEAKTSGVQFSNDDTLIEITWPIAAKEVPKKIIAKGKRRSLDDLRISLKNFAESLKVAVCFSSNEKYELLDKLDKRIREGIRRDPKDYKVLVGTCRDMCPERERYFRNDKNQYSSFEATDGSLDPLKAVKEYSRSSADQEVPLPHELRTVSALNVTMNYLVTNIMKIENSTVSEWFDFLWNRTRAIRKDITQQNLKCETSISIVEKCARFHIYCSHFLCEEEMHVFDSKINLENLTKCLQTLKHMYEDHLNEYNRICPNEAEFRCYQILLNLNDGDTLREVMEFTDEIRKSEPVKFALQAFSAVQENNYSRFFKLMIKADFLSSCLMHPYFTQLRAIALKRMSRAYVVPKQSDVPYPLEELVNSLVFNDEESAAAFCEHYGFSTDQDYIYLSRSSYDEPEERYPHERCRIIEKNGLVSTMAAIVNGGAVKNLPAYFPANSFSSSGHYVGLYQDLSGVPEETTVVEDQIDGFAKREEEDKSDPTFNVDKEEMYDDDEEEDEEVEDDEKDQDYVPELKNDVIESEEQIMILREDIKKISTELVDEMIEDVIKSTFTLLHSQWQENLKEAKHFVEYIIAIVSVEDAKNIATESFEETKKEIQKEETEILDTNTKHFCNHLIEGVVSTLLNDVCSSVYKDCVVKKEAALVATECNIIHQNLIDETVLGMIKHIAHSVYKDTAIEKKTVLVKYKHDFQRRKLAAFFKQWIKAYKSHMYVKATLHDFPSHAPMISTREAIRHLNIRETDEQPRHLNVCADVTWLDNELYFKQAVKNFHTQFEKKQTELLKPICLKDTLQKELCNLARHGKSKLHSNKILTWNMEVITSQPINDKSFQQNTRLKASTFLKKLNTLSQSLQLDKNTNVMFQNGAMNSNQFIIQYSVKHVRSVVPNMFLSTSCLLFIIDVTNSTNVDQFLHHKCQHLRRLLSTTRSNPDPPFLFVVVIGNPVKIDSKIVSSQLGVSELKSNKLISQSHCVVFDEVVSNINHFNESFREELRVVAEQCNLKMKVVSKPLSTFVEDGLSELFFPSYNRYCLHCKKTKLPSPNPSDVILFYNNVIGEIADVINTTTMQSNEDFQEEIRSTDDFVKRCEDLSNNVADLKLPQLHGLFDSSGDTDFSTNYHSCMQYTSQLKGNDSSALLNRVNILLRDHNLSITDPNMYIFPWSDLLELFIVNQLSVMYTTCDDMEQVGYHTMIHFLPCVWSNIIVDNPLKNHMHKFNASLRDFNESATKLQLKRKKFCRESNVQDSIVSVNDELSLIEETMRQRKSRRKSHDQNSPISDLVNQSIVLTQEIYREKEDVIARKTSYSNLNPNAKSFYPRTKRHHSSAIPVATKKMLVERTPNSLEDSVIGCLKSIDDTCVEWSQRQEYWERIING